MVSRHNFPAPCTYSTTYLHEKRDERGSEAVAHHQHGNIGVVQPPPRHVPRVENHVEEGHPRDAQREVEHGAEGTAAEANDEGLAVAPSGGARHADVGMRADPPVQETDKGGVAGPGKQYCCTTASGVICRRAWRQADHTTRAAEQNGQAPHDGKLRVNMARREEYVHRDVPGGGGAEGSHEEAHPADEAERCVTYPAHAGALQVGRSRWSHDVAEHDEGKQEHGDLCDGRVLHFQKAFRALLLGQAE